MGVDGDAGRVEAFTEHDVGRLTSDAGKLHEFVERAGDIAVVFFDEHFAARFDRLGLVAKETGRANHLLQFFVVDLREISCS